MANVLIEESSLTAIANAIRDRNNSNTTYKPSEMDEAINNLITVDRDEWVRPADWPDYSQVDISNNDVIYLTYDTTMDNGWISIIVYGDYIVERGSLNNGIFTSVSSTNCTSGTSFKEHLPTNEGTYVVYKITPQPGKWIDRFFFARRDDLDSSFYYYAQHQPCIERYARLPYWSGLTGRTSNQYTWTTLYLIADTIIDSNPTGSLNNLYNENASLALEKIDLSTCSLANITNLSGAFSGRYKLHDLKLPHDLSSSCTNLSSCFANCRELKYLNLTGWDTSKVTTTANMFDGCYHLVEIKGIENFDVSSCVNISKMFNNCNDIQKLNLSSWEISTSLTTMNEMFYSCRNLKELDLKGFNTTNVTSLYYTFSNCWTLEQIDLRGDWTVTNKCTNLNNTFSVCPNLKDIKRNLDWDTSNVTNFDSMFKECRKLKTIDISDFDFSNATTVRYMFQKCNNLENITATVNLPKVTARVNASAFLEDCWKLNDLSTITFTNCSFMPGLRYDYLMEKVIVPTTVTGLGEGCFANLEHCKYLDFSNLSSVPTLASANDIITGYNLQLKLFVPTNLFETWLSTSPWNQNALIDRTFPYSDFALYQNTDQNITSMDLSEINWERNYTYRQNAAAGTAYNSMVNAGTTANAKRIASGLIDLPTNCESVCILVNPGYAFTVFDFDENGNYLAHYVEWKTAEHLVHPSTIKPTKKIAIFIRLGDGSNFLYPEDWANSGISIKYIPTN